MKDYFDEKAKYAMGGGQGLLMAVLQFLSLLLFQAVVVATKIIEPAKDYQSLSDGGPTFCEGTMKSLVKALVVGCSPEVVASGDEDGSNQAQEVEHPLDRNGHGGSAGGYQLPAIIK